MTHEEIVAEFTRQDLIKGDLVEVEFSKGKPIKKYLSYSFVVYEDNNENTKINSCIYLQSANSPFNENDDRFRSPYQVENITKITRIKP
jgi:hypothetical protein